MGELRPGTMVTPNVRLVEILARGGMGSVWMADHLSLETRVAVKFIKPEIAERDTTVRERFKREASIAAKIRSIHVVQVFDHGVMGDSTPYIVMELLEGRMLTDVVEGDGPMGLRRVGMVVSHVAKVLQRAHALGIIHRDIKPDNIYLIDSDYELFTKVLDFGIAKQTQAGAKRGVTKTGVVVGTPEFMSPEQAVSSKDIDFRTDLYSLAVVAYYALTGKLPFDPEKNEPIWMQMASGRFPPLATYRTGLPKQLDSWFKKAMHPKPSGRFQSAKVMADVLAEIIGGASHAGGVIVDELSSVTGPVSRRRVEIELDSMSDVDDEAPATSDPSLPAQYDLFGPDSEAFGPHATQLMDESDHRYADAKGQQPVGKLDKPELPEGVTVPVPDSGGPSQPRFNTEPSAGVDLPAPAASPSAPSALASSPSEAFPSSPSSPSASSSPEASPSAPQPPASPSAPQASASGSGSWEAAAHLPLATLADTETGVMPVDNQKRWAIVALCAVVALAVAATLVLIR